MSSIHSSAKFVLVIVNLLFLLIALGLIVLGFFILVSFTDIFTDYFDSTVESIQRDVKTTFGQDLSKDLDALYKVYEYFGATVIIFGCILLLLSLLGLIGSCCKVKNILFLYMFILCALIIAQIVVLCLFIFQEDTMKKALKTPLKETIKHYEGSNGTNEESWAWNFVMREYKCCGIEDYKDFHTYSSKWWGLTEHLTPYMCCITFPTNSAEGDTCAGASSTAAVSTIDGLNYYNKGCLDKVWDKAVNQKVGFYIIGLFILFGFQFLVVVFSCILYCEDDQEDHDTPRRRRRNKVNPGVNHGIRRPQHKPRQPPPPRAMVEAENW